MSQFAIMKPMFHPVLKFSAAILLALVFSTGLALASEEEGDAEKKAKPPEKPKPDSAISQVLQLPEVKKWAEWITSQNDGRSITAWGEAIKTVGETQCWEVGIGESDPSGNVKTWARFCQTQFGSDVWVETKQPTSDEIIYLPYDKWISLCHPTYKSPGICQSG